MTKKIKICMIAMLLVIFLALVFYFKIWNYGTIYRQNNDNNYPKTKIEIPKHSGYLIAIYKDEHKLKLYKDNKIIKKYNVNIKREEEDRKVWEDSQTPEGIFKIESMDVVSNGWSRWMRLDTTEKAIKIYKKNVKNGEEFINEFEKKFGLIKNYLDIREFNSIYSNHKMLSGIGIHGGGFYLFNEWTQGCVAMSNKDVAELFNLLKHGEKRGINVPVIIQD